MSSDTVNIIQAKASLSNFSQVCRASKQFLKLMARKPVIRVQDINPMLFNFVEELTDVKVGEMMQCVHMLVKLDHIGSS